MRCRKCVFLASSCTVGWCCPPQRHGAATTNRYDSSQTEAVTPHFHFHHPSRHRLPLPDTVTTSSHHLHRRPPPDQTDLSHVYSRVVAVILFFLFLHVSYALAA